MNEMANEHCISCKFYKVTHNIKKILCAFQVRMGQFMDYNTLAFQFALGLDKPVKGLERQNCRSAQLDGTYRNNGVLLKIKPGQLSVKCYKINLPD